MSNLLDCKGLNAFGLLLRIGIKGVLLLSILSLNLSCGRWMFLAIRKRKLASLFPGVSLCRIEKDEKIKVQCMLRNNYLKKQCNFFT